MSTRVFFFALLFAQGILLGQNAVTPTGADMQHVGVYAWDGRPCGQTALTDSVQAAKNLGAQMVRIYAGPYWDYRCGQPDKSPLDVKLQRPDYAWVLTGAGLKEIWVTAYDTASFGLYKAAAGGFQTQTLARHADRNDQLTGKQAHARGFPSVLSLLQSADWTGTYGEFFRAAYNTACTVPNGTTVHFSNWEAGNDIPDPSLWPTYVPYLQTRVNAINDGNAKAQADGCKGQVKAAAEFIDPPSFPRNGMTQTDFVGVISHLTGLRALSYSAWRTLDQDTQTLQLSLQVGLGDIRDRAWQFGLPADLYLGEFGNPRTVHPDVADRMAIIITTALAKGVKGLVYWNLVDQNETDSHGRFVGDLGLYTKAGQLTETGQVYQDWIRTLSTQPIPRATR